MLGAAAACARILKLDAGEDGDGAGHRRVAADRRARTVRLDDQGAPYRRRRARGAHVGADGAARLHRVDARARSAARPAADLLEQVRLDARSRTSSAQRFEISFNTYKPFACGIVIHPSIDGCRQLRDAHRPARRRHRAHRSAGPSAGARADRQARAEDRPRSQVQRLPRLRRGDPVRPSGRSRILGCRRRRAATSSRCAIASMPGSTRRSPSRPPT